MITTLKLTESPWKNATSNFRSLFRDKKNKDGTALKIATANSISLSTQCSSEQIEDLSILIGRYEFLGPYLDPEDIARRPGLLAILVQVGVNLELFDLYEGMDLRQSAQSAILCRASIENAFSFAVHYLKDSSVEEREQLRDEIMKEFSDDEP